MKKEVYNLQTIKASNRTAILYLLNEKGNLSRKQISHELGLTAAAVTKITAKLLEEGVIKERESIGTGVGRKEVLLSLEYGSYKAFCVSFEIDEINYSIASLSGELIESHKEEFTNDFSKVKESIKKYYSEAKKKYDFLGAGISIIGRENKYGIWPNVNIQEELSKIIDVPIIVRNNVKAFATSTVLYNEHKGEKNVLVFKWGPGIGSSFIRDGMVLSGDDQGIAEIGHMIVNPQGKLCRCGRRGCLETETSLNVIIEEVKELGYNLTIEEVINSKEPKIEKLLDSKIEMVCLALMNASTILDAKKIILFGSIFKNSSFTERFLTKWNEVSNNIKYNTLILSSLNDKSSFIGSTAIVARKLFFEKGI